MKNVLLAVAITMVLLAAPATAYKTLNSNNGKVTLKYGNFDEPVATFQKTGIDLGILDAKGNPIVGLEAMSPKLNVTLTFGPTPDTGMRDLTNGLKAQAGRPGWYTHPITYTQAGLYYLHIDGMINGTRVKIDIAPEFSVKESTEFMFPAVASPPDAQDAKIAQLERDVAALKAVDPTKVAPGLGGFAIEAVLLAFAAIVAARRPRLS